MGLRGSGLWGNLSPSPAKGGESSVGPNQPILQISFSPVNMREKWVAGRASGKEGSRGFFLGAAGSGLLCRGTRVRFCFPCGLYNLARGTESQNLPSNMLSYRIKVFRKE